MGRVRLTCLLIFVLAWGLRLAYVQEARRAGLTFVEAAAPAEERSLDRPDAREALAVWARAGFKDGARAALFLQVLQAAAGALTAVTVALLAMGLFGLRAGAAAGLLYAVAGPAIFHEQRPSAAGLHTLLIVATVAALHHARGLGKRGRWAAAALLLCAAAWASPAFAAAWWVVLAWTVLSRSPEGRGGERSFAVLVCGAALALALASWRGFGGWRQPSPGALSAVFSAAEPGALLNYEFWRTRLGPVAAWTPSWLPTAGLAAAGAALLARRAGTAALLLGVPAAGALWLAGRWADGADRLWIMALLCAPAGYALARVAGAVWRVEAAPLAVGVGVWAVATAALAPAAPYRATGEDFLLAGRVAERAGRHRAAAEAYAQGLARDPSNAALAERACWASLRDVDLAPALERCAGALRLAPASATAAQGVGLALRSAGQYDGAEEAFSRARDLDPYDAFTYVNLGYLQVRRGDMESALRSLDEAERLGAGGHDVYYQLGLLYRLTGRPQRAIEAFRRGLKARPRDLQARVQLARMLEETGDYAAARTAYEEILGREEGRPDVHLRLGLLYDQRIGDPQKALDHLRRALSLDPRQRDAEALARLIRDVENRLIFGAEPPPDEDLAAESEVPGP